MFAFKLSPKIVHLTSKILDNIFKENFNIKELSEHQILSILKEAEAGIPVKELCCQYLLFINGKINMEVCNHRILNG